MSFSKRTLEVLLDLLEIKISSFVIYDKSDELELLCLKKAKKELTGYIKNACCHAKRQSNVQKTL